MRMKTILSAMLAVIKCTGTDGTSAPADITVSSFQIEALR
jgi:hypothetical protein